MCVNMIDLCASVLILTHRSCKNNPDEYAPLVLHASNKTRASVIPGFRTERIKRVGDSEKELHKSEIRKLPYSTLEVHE